MVVASHPVEAADSAVAAIVVASAVAVVAEVGLFRRPTPRSTRSVWGSTCTPARTV